MRILPSLLKVKNQGTSQKYKKYRDKHATIGLFNKRNASKDKHSAT